MGEMSELVLFLELNCPSGSVLASLRSCRTNVNGLTLICLAGVGGGVRGVFVYRVMFTNGVLFITGGPEYTILVIPFPSESLDIPSRFRLRFSISSLEPVGALVPEYLVLQSPVI